MVDWCLETAFISHGVFCHQLRFVCEGLRALLNGYFFIRKSEPKFKIQLCFLKTARCCLAPTHPPGPAHACLGNGAILSRNFHPCQSPWVNDIWPDLSSGKGVYSWDIHKKRSPPQGRGSCSGPKWCRNHRSSNQGHLTDPTPNPGFEHQGSSSTQPPTD